MKTSDDLAWVITILIIATILGIVSSAIAFCVTHTYYWITGNDPLTALVHTFVLFPNFFLWFFVGAIASYIFLALKINKERKNDENI